MPFFVKQLSIMTTTDLSFFGNRELYEAGKLLVAMAEKGLPDDFENEGVTVMFNDLSGSVFLSNDTYQVAMLADDGTLYSFYTSPYEGIEGSFEDLLSEYKNMDHNDQQWFEDLAKTLGRKDEIPTEA